MPDAQEQEWSLMFTWYGWETKCGRPGTGVVPYVHFHVYIEGRLPLRGCFSLWDGAIAFALRGK